MGSDSLFIQQVVPAKTGTRSPEPVVTGARFRRDDPNAGQLIEENGAARWLARRRDSFNSSVVIAAALSRTAAPPRRSRAAAVSGSSAYPARGTAPGRYP